MIARLATRIEGLDGLLEGGFPEGAPILLQGKPGTGKTIFSLEFLMRGIEKGEVGIYFTFEEKKDDLFTQASLFGWDFAKYEEASLLYVIPLGIQELATTSIHEMLNLVKELHAKRVVFDSISTLWYLLPEQDMKDQISVKRFLYVFLSELKKLEGVVSLCIGQYHDSITASIAQYLCDGIITLEHQRFGGEYSRQLQIIKMRKTKNDEDIHPVEISEEGIKIHSIS